MLTLVFCLGVSFVSALHDFPDASKKEGPSNTHTYTRTHTHTHTHTGRRGIPGAGAGAGRARRRPQQASVC